MKKYFSFAAFVLLASAMTFSLSACGGDDDDNEVNNGGGSVNLCPDDNHPHSIDMVEAGFWACCNVGASKPEEFGNYYACGETETINDYSYWTYKHRSENDYKDIGYDIGGNITYDVATKEWGSIWRLPSQDKVEKLMACKSEWTQINKVNGRLFTASNGNKIFLPAAGVYTDTTIKEVGNYGVVSSSTLYENNKESIKGLYFSPGLVWLLGDYRYVGHTVRPVRQ